MKQKLTVLAASALIALPMAIAARPLPEKSGNAAPFKWMPSSQAEKSRWSGLDSSSRLKSVVSEADSTIPSAEGFAYLDMPDGKTWFVSYELDKTVIAQNEHYAEYDITGVKAVVYDDNYQPVGKINAPIVKPEGMEKCSQVKIGACVTKKFFNIDNNYEIMLAANFKPTGSFGSRQYTYVYSLRGPETDAEQVMSLKGYYTMAINSATDAWSEDFFMEFFADEYDDDEGLYQTFDIYSKASYSSPTAEKLDSFTVNYLYVMSDGENEPIPVAINARGRDLFVSVAQYEKTFFKNPFDPTDDTLSEDNHYNIELYKKGSYGSKLEKISTTSIPVAAPGGAYTMRSYALGMFSGYKDLTFDFNTGDKPAFILSIVSSDFAENSESYYEVIDTEGKSLGTFGRDNLGYIRMSDVEGQSQQYCFLMPSATAPGGYEFSLVDFPSLEQQTTIPLSISYEGKDTALSLDIDRVPAADSYRYAVGSLYAVNDDDDNTCHLVAWFDEEGELSHVDRLNGGQRVNLISPYIVANGLDPYLFNTDDAQEYMILVQRRAADGGAATNTELLVVNDREETLAQYVFDGKDSGITVSLVNLGSTPAIWLSYSPLTENTVHNEFIRLPFNSFEGSGTAEDPYLIRTQGDFRQIKHNLNAHYRIANDIDYRGDRFETVAGSFTGSIDGAGHTVKNVSLAGAPMFETIGKSDSRNKSVIRDLTLRNVAAESSRAILAGSSYGTLFENVYILNMTAEGEPSEFGALVGNANLGSEIISCAVRGDIDLPLASGVGGIVSALGNDSKISASSFIGDINARSVAGGIAATGMASASISDCHVTADIEAGNNVGGVIGSSARTSINRCLVEGSLEATAPADKWSDYAGTNVKEINVGGIAGNLDAPTVEYDQNGKPIKPDPSLPPVISGCVVALDEITIPDDKDLLATAHRIVGRSSINNDPEMIDMVYNPDTYDYDYVWGDPAPAEDKLSDNYALASLPVMQSSVTADKNTTEGKDVAESELGLTFFEGLGYGFDAKTAEKPWIMRGDNLAALHFEEAVAYYMEFIPGTISVVEGKTESVVLLLDNIDLDDVTLTSSDPANCTATVKSAADEGAEIEISVTKPGTYTVAATNGATTAQLTVTGTSGIESVTTGPAISFTGTEVIADGCEITLYTLAGTAVAHGNGTVSTAALEKGVYIAVATAADGTRRTLKISAR